MVSNKDHPPRRRPWFRVGYSMTKDETVKIFNRQRVRTHWDEEAEKWYFSIVDVVAILTDSADPNNYWKVLKSRLIKEGNKSVTNCNRLKMRSPKDGKYYKTDVADTFEQNQEIARRSDKVAGDFCRQNYFSRNRQSKLLN